MNMAKISIETLQREQRAALRRVETSLAALKNQTGEYAEQHRTLIACRQEICAVIDRHTASFQPQQ